MKPVEIYKVHPYKIVLVSLSWIQINMSKTNNLLVLPNILWSYQELTGVTGDALCVTWETIISVTRTQFHPAKCHITH